MNRSGHSESDTHDSFETHDWDLAHFLGLLSASRWLIAAAVILCLAAGTVYSLVRTPVYTADTKLRVLAAQSGGLTGLEQLSAIIQGAAVPTDTEIQLLQTRSVLVPVIQRLHLNVAVRGGWLSGLEVRFGLGCPSPVNIDIFDVPASLEGQEFALSPEKGGDFSVRDPQGRTIARGQSGQMIVVRLPEGAGLLRLRINGFAACAGRVHVKLIPMDQAVTALARRLTIQEEGQNTGVITVRLRGADPQFLTETLNGIALTNVQNNVRLSATQAARQLDFLGGQLPGLEGKLQQSQTKLAAFLSENPTLAVLSQNTGYLITQITTLDQQIGPLIAETSRADAELGPRNPQLIALKKQLESLQAERAEALKDIAKLPQSQQAMVTLQSDVTNNQSLYTAMLNQIQSLQIAKAGVIGDVVIVDPAILPSVPSYLKAPLVMAICGLMGLFLGILAAMAMRALWHGIEDPEVIDRELGLPVHAILPHCPIEKRLARRRLSGIGKGSVLSEIAPKEPTIEALRSLRTALQLLLPAQGPRIMAVTSFSPGEGKSFLVSNLGYLFSQIDLSVLIIDADLRRGHLHQSFGWRRGLGLSDVLRGDAELSSVIRSCAGTSLDVLTTGTLPDDPAKLLSSPALGETLHKLASHYDLVIVDMPPVMAVSDAVIIAQHITHTLLVLKYGEHSIRQAQFALKQMSQQGVALSGCVLNDVSIHAQRYAYRGYGYQYQYHYK